jgi:kynureninase
MAGLLFASHPRPVREAITRHREELQRDPASYISHERWRLEGEVLKSAATYLGAQPADIALTDSTSMGLGLLYSGLKLTPRDEILTTSHDHYATEAAVAACADRTGCMVKRIDMFRQSFTATADEIVDAVRRGVSASTRIVAMTWGTFRHGAESAGAAIADIIADETKSAGRIDESICAWMACMALGSKTWRSRTRLRLFAAGTTSGCSGREGRASCGEGQTPGRSPDRRSQPGNPECSIR